VNIFLPMQKFTSAENYLAFFCIYLEISHYIYFYESKVNFTKKSHLTGFVFKKFLTKFDPIFTTEMTFSTNFLS
jgi:hypothetical protein